MTPPAAEGRLLPPKHGATIRMYRQGLGDCFLVTFPRGDGAEPFNLLIDCGVILGTRAPETPMTAIARDVAQATGGRIDVLVVTHEHWDHVSGFLQAEDVWRSALRVEAVWMAWTEDMRIGLARRLKEEFNNDLNVLRLAVDLGAAQAPMRIPLTGLVEFFGDPVGLMAAAKRGHRFSEVTHEALRKVHEMAGERGVEYRHPGEALELEGVPDVRVYVLGPPQDEGRLRKINPSKRTPQTYPHAAGLPPDPPAPRPTEKAAFTLALKARAPKETAACLTEAEEELSQRCFPFERHLRVPLSEAGGLRFFHEHYGFAGAPAGVGAPALAAAPRVPPAPGAEWRRLDDPLFAGFEDAAPLTRGSRRSKKTKAPPERSFPFDAHLRVPLSEAARLPFFQEFYGFQDDGAAARVAYDLLAAPAPEVPRGPGPEWRRIEKEWMGAAGELALQMDSYTNNTSLVLAIELTRTGKVLLFAADAQVGNWLSWDEIETFTSRDGQAVTAADLLRRTVFYKVGHHGSHNATLRELGLERMTSPELVAFVPVDERVAHEVKNWREMPFGPLLARLYEKTRGRVVRLDHGVVTDECPEFLAPDLWERIAPTARDFDRERVRARGRFPHADPDLKEPLCFEVEIPDVA